MSFSHPTPPGHKYCSRQASSQLQSPIIHFYTHIFFTFRISSILQMQLFCQKSCQEAHVHSISSSKLIGKRIPLPFSFFPIFAKFSGSVLYFITKLLSPPSANVRFCGLTPCQQVSDFVDSPPCQQVSDLYAVRIPNKCL